MKKQLFCLTFILFSIKIFSAGGYITISSSVPSDLTICGNAKTFAFTITNPSPFTLTNVTADMIMPSGINYMLLSVSNASTSVSSNTNTLTFTLNNLAPNSSVVITYSAMANCSIINYLNTGSPVENNIQVNYNVSGVPNFDTHTSSSYSILQPNLSITNITNQSFAGTVGGTFTRCITVTNGGTGALSSFNLSNTHNNSTAITAISTGTMNSAVGVDTYYLSGADFTAIGNNNNLFESGESITICETVTITNCNNASAAYEAYWGVRWAIVPKLIVVCEHHIC